MKTGDNFHRLIWKIEGDTGEYCIGKLQGPQTRLCVEGECNAPSARYSDGVWDGDDIGYIEEPAGTISKIRISMLKQEYNFEMYPVLGTKCPNCELTQCAKERAEFEKRDNQSHGEKLLREILENLCGAKFPNTRPLWLKNPDTGHSLELDCYNAKMKIAFEYQGIQHYEPVNFFGGREKYEKRKERDKIKKEICKKRGIRLVEIDAREFPYNKTTKLKRHIKSLVKSLLTFS